MSNNTKSIADFSALSKIKAPEPEDTPTRKEAWPDRSSHVEKPEKEEVEQISLRAPASQIKRLKTLCKEERYSYGQMLERLLNAYEGRGS